LKVPFGSLLSVSESSPVAGAIQGINPCISLDAGRARELQKAPSQPHKCSRFTVYTNPHRKVQALIDFFAQMFTVGVPPIADVIRRHAIRASKDRTRNMLDIQSSRVMTPAIPGIGSGGSGALWGMVSFFWHIPRR